MAKDSQSDYRTQETSVFTASEARSAGFIAAPAQIVKHYGIVAGQTLGTFRSLFLSDGKIVFRRQAAIAKLAGLSRPTVRKAVKVLVDAGLLVTEQPDPRETIRYRLTRAGVDVLGEAWLPIPRYVLGLPGAQRAVYAVLVWRAELSPRGDLCFDGRTKVAAMAGLPRTSAMRAIGALEQAGYIQREEGPAGEAVRVRLLRPPGRCTTNISANSSCTTTEPPPDPPVEGGPNVSIKAPKRFHGGGPFVSSLVRSGFEKTSKNHGGFQKLTKISKADLQDGARLTALYLKAVRIGVTTDTPANRDRWAGAAVHALAHGSNPPAMFAWMVANEKWEFITCEEEDRGRRRKQPPRKPCQGAGREEGEAARRARVVRELELMAKAG